MRRYQKVMRSRYYKLARRRAVWESEDLHIRPWRHHRFWAARHCGYKPLSSTGISNNEPKEPRSEYDSENDTRTVYDDFESFRAAVDKAIARDPYGTLFGRRLQSPPSSNNSSWTSFSWFTDPKEIKEETDAAPPQNRSSESAKMTAEKVSKPASPTPTPNMIKETTLSYVEEEYEYDPITMRKVPVKKQSEETRVDTQPPAPPSEKQPSSPDTKKPSSRPEGETKLPPLLQKMFFQEHGVDIPVKTFKPHKVFGYGMSDEKATDHSTESDVTGPKKDFSTSRKQEFRDLMSRTKGNSIDTSGFFTEASTPSKSEANTDEPILPKKPRDSPAPDDTLPLFSGTTYEGRAPRKPTSNSSDWLVKEGFRQANTHEQSTKIAKDAAVDIPVKPFNAKLEPALDRVQARATQESNTQPPRLETALDRQLSASRPIGSSSTRLDQAKVKTSSEENELHTRQYQVDPQKRWEEFKRITDANRAAQQSIAKQQRQAKLEADFEARQKDAANEIDYSPKARKTDTSTSKLSKAMNNVWEHVREYPNGIVARTMNSMTNLNENYKKYIRPNAISGLTDKLVFKDESLSKTASIYKRDVKPRKVETFTPSHEILTEETHWQQWTATLKDATEKAKEDAQVQKAQISKLANEIQSVYESEYGPIDAKHKQAGPGSAKRSDSPEIAASPPKPRHSSEIKPHPLSTASIKPGVTTNPVIDQHITTFEPKLAELVDNAKQVHAQLRDIQTESQDLLKLGSSKVQSSSGVSEAERTLSTWNEVIQGTKEVRRALHETQNEIRVIERKRPVNAWSSPQLSGADFGQKRIDIRVEKAPEPEISSDTNKKEPRVEPEVLKASESVEEKVQKTVPEPVHTPAGSPIWNDEQIPSIENLKVRKFNAPYLVLTYNTTAGKVDISPSDQPIFEMPRSVNAVHILARLKNASEFLKHFQVMQKAGYTLYNGSSNELIFQRSRPEQAKGPVTNASAATATSEAKSVPEQKPSATQPEKEAAKVLEELPTDLNPPGPAAPTAPPSRPYIDVPKVRRQENVFSGTIRPNTASPSEVGPGEKAGGSQPGEATPKVQKESFWRRFTRGVRRTLLTITALGVGAYTIGFISEGLGAHTQQQKAIEDGRDAPGPRKRIVVTGQRPGIYSTESSR